MFSAMPLLSLAQLKVAGWSVILVSSPRLNVFSNVCVASDEGVVSGASSVVVWVWQVM